MPDYGKARGLCLGWRRANRGERWQPGLPSCRPMTRPFARFRLLAVALVARAGCAACETSGTAPANLGAARRPSIRRKLFLLLRAIPGGDNVQASALNRTRFCLSRRFLPSRPQSARAAVVSAPASAAHATTTSRWMEETRAGATTGGLRQAAGARLGESLGRPADSPQSTSTSIHLHLEHDRPPSSSNCCNTSAISHISVGSRTYARNP